MSRIEDLLSRMTLAEKLGQLTMLSGDFAVTGPDIAGASAQEVRAGTLGSVLNVVGRERVRALQRLAVEESRLKVPLLVCFDVIHGFRTLFPVPLAEAGLFDPLSWEQTARESAAETAADGIALTFAPMLDIARDPRWGRGAEGPGEDPYVGARMAEAKVRGFQGRDLTHPSAIAACAKHFCGYGAVTAGREYASIEVSDRTMLEVYAPPFAAAVEAGVAAVMPAFVDLAGIPMTASTFWLRDILRERLGFEGVLLSDYNSIGELIQHGVAADLAEAAAYALKAGVDIDMMANAYRRGLPLALERGLVTLAQIDTAVLRVLALKERLGLFDEPYARGADTETPEMFARRRTLAREVSGRAIVMLRNERETLPLAASIGALAVVGPLADAPAEMGGPWPAAGGQNHVSVLAGLRAALPHTRLHHAAGVRIDGEDAGTAEALAACRAGEAVVLCVGEGWTWSGEAASRAHLGLPGTQGAFAQAVLRAARAQGKPVIVVLFSGRPLIEPAVIAEADAVLAAWFLGTEAGNAVADVLTGRISPSARTPITWPRVTGQIPIFFAERPTGRPCDPRNHFTSQYLDVVNEPLFAFGHGLTYGRFSCSNLRVEPHTAGADGRFEVEVEVHNSGPRQAQETLFLFVHDRLASVARPRLELKSWGKITLAPGERGTLRLELPAAQLRFIGRDLRSVFEPGEVEILVGPSADLDRLLSTTVRLI